ncbi:hypothetical protein Tco_0374703 [Tanacetum coccineum]
MLDDSRARGGGLMLDVYRGSEFQSADVVDGERFQIILEIDRGMLEGDERVDSCRNTYSTSADYPTLTVMQTSTEVGYTLQGQHGPAGVPAQPDCQRKAV